MGIATDYIELNCTECIYFFLFKDSDKLHKGEGIEGQCRIQRNPLLISQADVYWCGDYIDERGNTFEELKVASL